MMGNESYQAIANDAITILFHISRQQSDADIRKLARILQSRYEKLLVGVE
jgi:hypothetical protein